MYREKGLPLYFGLMIVFDLLGVPALLTMLQPCLHDVFSLALSHGKASHRDLVAGLPKISKLPDTHRPSDLPELSYRILAQSSLWTWKPCEHSVEPIFN